ncbi:putative tubulin-tyrosine ligase family protein [Neospora caninum Liverpool]|uniref:Putative tubulin-tyrosine ligase family protein n=1 Tax=Neospora caninum (strain Liverpool) TaxID=572307 RepID=F0VEH2_NEOCL|nr:putative tubulin-tyrosine ligase family protein [Neospora caninum Liverpool]CBZ52116.1 putative tubulin-tyrosine ligase family protein [Neospora caninum Liverpool]CEL66078.1 TPA: tubulin-tyrosine ligase family protein, putative [Neospora caninum Liverpool]|eukprot:XP_003882148.1 putative tubulin-tyrosine ligase family protein [Neospora caninum Liverpool]
MMPFPTVGALPPAGAGPTMNNRSTIWRPPGVTHTTPPGLSNGTAAESHPPQPLNLSTGYQCPPTRPLQPVLQCRFVAGTGHGTQGAPAFGAFSAPNAGYFAGAPVTQGPSQMLPATNAGSWRNPGSTEQPPMTRHCSPTFLLQSPGNHPGGGYGHQSFAKIHREGLPQAPIFRTSTPTLIQGQPLPRLPNSAPKQDSISLGIPELQRNQTPQQPGFCMQSQQVAATQASHPPQQRPRAPTQVELPLTHLAGNPVRQYPQSDLRQDRPLPHVAVRDVDRDARHRFLSPSSQRVRLTPSDSCLTGQLAGQTHGIVPGAQSVSSVGGQAVHPGNQLRHSASLATDSGRPHLPHLTVQQSMDMAKKQSVHGFPSTPSAPASDGVLFAPFAAQKALANFDVKPDYRKPTGDFIANMRPNLCEPRLGQADMLHPNYSFFVGQGMLAASYTSPETLLHGHGNRLASQAGPAMGSVPVQPHTTQKEAHNADGHSTLSPVYPDKVSHTRLIPSPGHNEQYGGLFVPSSEAKERGAATLVPARVTQSPASLVAWQSWRRLPHQDIRWPQQQIEAGGGTFCKRAEGSEEGKPTETPISCYGSAHTLELGREQRDQGDPKPSPIAYQSGYGKLTLEGVEDVPKEETGECREGEDWSCVDCARGPGEVAVEEEPPVEDQVTGDTESEVEEDAAKEFEDDAYPLESSTLSGSPDAEGDRSRSDSVTAPHSEAGSPANGSPRPCQSHSEEAEALSEEEDEDSDSTTHEEIPMPWENDPWVDVQIPSPRQADAWQPSAAASISASMSGSAPSQARSPSPGSVGNAVAATTKNSKATRASGHDQERGGKAKGAKGYTGQSHDGEPGRKGEDNALRGTMACAIPWNEVVLNTKMCRAERPLINTIGHRLGWSRQDQVSTKGNIVWLGGSVPDHEHLQFMKPLQLVNRFPGMWDMTKKRMLSRILSLYQQLYPDLFDFSPETWSLPEDRDVIKRILHNKNQEVFILKPDGGAMGNGVQLVSRFKDIDAMVLRGDGNYIMQRYVHNPYLMNKRKFDFRIYCMLFSVNGTPKAYISKLGMARFCTEQYRAPTRRNIDNPFMHLTNYSINKDNTTSFVRSTDLHDDSNSKRMLKDVLEDLAKDGVNIVNVWDQIKSITARTVVCLYPWLNLRYRHVYKVKDTEPSRCFQLLGLDILLDTHEKCWLLEVNSNPSLRIDYFDSKYEGIDVQLESAMDRHIKEPVVSEGLGLAYRLLLQHRRRGAAGVVEKGKASRVSSSTPPVSHSSRGALRASGSRSSLATRGLSQPKTTSPEVSSATPSVPSRDRSSDSFCSAGRGEGAAAQCAQATSGADSPLAQGAATGRAQGTPREGDASGAPCQPASGSGPVDGGEGGIRRLESSNLATTLPGKEVREARREDREGGLCVKRAASVRASKRLGKRSSSAASRRDRGKGTLESLADQRDMRSARRGEAPRDAGVNERRTTQKSEEEAADDIHGDVELGMEQAVEKVRAFLAHMGTSGGSSLAALVACGESAGTVLRPPARMCLSPEPRPVGKEPGRWGNGDGRSAGEREGRKSSALSHGLTSRLTTTSSSRAPSRKRAVASHASESGSEHRSRSRGRMQAARAHSETGRRGREPTRAADERDTGSAKPDLETKEVDIMEQGKDGQFSVSALSLSRSASVETAETPTSPLSCRDDGSSLTQSTASFPLQSSQPRTPSPRTPLDSLEERENAWPSSSSSPEEALQASVLATARPDALPEAEQLACELDWLDVAYKEMEKCMDGFNVLGLRFASSREKGVGGATSRDSATEDGKKKFPPGPYKPFLRKDRMAAKKVQSAVKASYTKLHKDILRPLSGEHAKPQHCWIDLASSVNALVAETTSVLRFQLLFERLIKFPKGITLQRAGLLEACRIVKLPDILRKIQVPIGNPPRPGCRSGVRSSAFPSHTHPTQARSYSNDAGQSFAFGRSNSRAHLQGNEAVLPCGSSLLSSVSTKSLLAAGPAGGPSQVFPGLQRPRLGAGGQMPLGAASSSTASVSRMPSVALLPHERRRRLGLPDVEALWYYHLQSVRKQLQMQESSYGLGLLETWYVFESIALICFPFLPSKAKLLEAFLNPTREKGYSNALSVSLLGGGVEKAEVLAADRRVDGTLRSQIAFAKDLEEALRKVEEEERLALPISKQGTLKRKTSKTAHRSPALVEGIASEDERRYSSRSTETETVAEPPQGQERGPECLLSRLGSDGNRPDASGQLSEGEGDRRSASLNLGDGCLPTDTGTSRSESQDGRRGFDSGRRLTSLPTRLRRKLFSGEDEGLGSLAGPLEGKARTKEGTGFAALTEKTTHARTPAPETPAWYEGFCAAWPDVGEYVCRHVPPEDRREAMERLVDYFQLRWDYHNYCVMLQGGSV